uniref:LRX3 n=1 Tax=Catalpa bungei TaxID=265496 RepID=A0A142CD25_9LAMI|nr:LRX3 [Catalpa bungei]
MEYPWRPRPPTGNFCPVCTNSHFPFCPPLPPQYFRPPPPPPPPDQFLRGPLPPPLPPPVPPPPPPPQASYDPFVDHQGGPTVHHYPPPPQAQIPPRPWNGNPSFGNDYYGSSNPGLDYDNNGQIGVKRMRVDTLSDDERRLKLIRDHGAVSHGVDRNYGGGYRSSSDNVEPGNFGDKRRNFGDRFQGIEGGYRPETISHTKQNYGEQKMAYHIENNKNHGHGNIVREADSSRKFEQPGGSHETVAYNNASYQEQRRNFSTESQEFNNQFLQSHAKHQHMMDPKSAYYGLRNRGENVGLVQDSQGFKGQPPLPTSPPPPLPVEPPRFRYPDSAVSSSASVPSSLFPIARDSALTFQSPYTTGSEAITSVSTHYSNRPEPNSNGYYPEEIQAVNMASSKTFKGEREEFSPRHFLVDKPKIIDASHILKHPHRANRPDHIVIILRGLPGSGKSYLAKVLRDLEVENGGIAPRIHSMDEYFMNEVEESEGSRSSGAGRGKKPVMKKVMEYCYEPEMEEAYRSSMLKAFKKTLDEGAFPFVIGMIFLWSEHKLNS